MSPSGRSLKSSERVMPNSFAIDFKTVKVGFLTPVSTAARYER
jgi:hypothetical protein